MVVDLFPLERAALLGGGPFETSLPTLLPTTWVGCHVVATTTARHNPVTRPCWLSSTIA
jgi:hypothetical protein